MDQRQYKMTFTFIGSDLQCIEQMEELLLKIKGSVHKELIEMSDQEAVIIELPKPEKNESGNHREITAQDNSCPDSPPGTRIEQFGNR